MKQLSCVESTLRSRQEGGWAKNSQGPHLVMHNFLGPLRSMCPNTGAYWRCFTFKSQPVAYWEKRKHWEKWPLSLCFSLYSTQHLESSSGPTVKRDNIFHELKGKCIYGVCRWMVQRKVAFVEITWFLDFMVAAYFRF